MPSTTSVCLTLYDQTSGIGFEVDLDGTKGLGLNYQRSDLQRFGKQSNKATFANNVTMLGTDRTLTNLRHLYRFDSVESLTDKQYDATLFVDGTDLLEGFGVLQIKQIIRDKDGILKFKCYLTGSNYAWRSRLKSTTLRDLHQEMGVHQKTAAVVQNSWDVVNYPYNYIGGVWLPINYGAWFNPGEIHISELTFSPYIKRVVEAYFEHIGWRVNGQAWWNTDIEINRAILPHIGTQVIKDSDPEIAKFDSGTFFIQNQRTYSQTQLTMSNGTLPWCNVSGSTFRPVYSWNPNKRNFGVPFDMQASFAFIGSVTSVAVGTYLQVVSNVRGQLASVIISPGTQTSTYTPYIYLQEGEDIELRINGGTLDMSNIADSAQVDFEARSILDRGGAPGKPGPALNPRIAAAYAYRNVTIQEVFDGLQDTFNAFFITNAAKKEVEIYSETEYFNRITKDITELVICEGAKIKEKPISNFCPNVQFRFKEDTSDTKAQDVLSKFSDDNLYGQDDTNTTVPKPEDPCRNITTNVFAATLTCHDGNIGFPMLHMTDEEEDWNPTADPFEDRSNNREFEMRIAFFEGMVASNHPTLTTRTWGFNFNNGTGTTNITPRVPYAYMIDSFNEDYTKPFFSYIRGKLGPYVDNTATQTLLLKYFPETLKLYQYNRRIEIPFTADLTRLMQLVGFDGYISYASREFGIGKFVLNAIKKFDPVKKIGLLEFLLVNTACAGDCISAERLGFLPTHLTDTIQPSMAYDFIKVFWQSDITQYTPGTLNATVQWFGVSTSGVNTALTGVVSYTNLTPGVEIGDFRSDTQLSPYDHLRAVVNMTYNTTTGITCTTSAEVILTYSYDPAGGGSFPNFLALGDTNITVNNL